MLEQLHCSTRTRKRHLVRLTLRFAQRNEEVQVVQESRESAPGSSALRGRGECTYHYHPFFETCDCTSVLCAIFLVPLYSLC